MKIHHVHCDVASEDVVMFYLVKDTSEGTRLPGEGVGISGPMGGGFSSVE